MQIVVQAPWSCGRLRQGAPVLSTRKTPAGCAPSRQAVAQSPAEKRFIDPRHPVRFVGEQWLDQPPFRNPSDRTVPSMFPSLEAVNTDRTACETRSILCTRGREDQGRSARTRGPGAEAGRQDRAPGPGARAGTRGGRGQRGGHARWVDRCRARIAVLWWVGFGGRDRAGRRGYRFAVAGGPTAKQPSERPAAQDRPLSTRNDSACDPGRRRRVFADRSARGATAGCVRHRSKCHPCERSARGAGRSA